MIKKKCFNKKIFSIFDRIIDGISITYNTPSNFKNMIYENKFNTMIFLNEEKMKDNYKKCIKTHFYNLNNIKKKENKINIITQILDIMYNGILNGHNILMIGKKTDNWIIYMLIIFFCLFFKWEINFSINYLKAKEITGRNLKIILIEEFINIINFQEIDKHISYLSHLLKNTYNNLIIKEDKIVIEKRKINSLFQVKIIDNKSIRINKSKSKIKYYK